MELFNIFFVSPAGGGKSYCCKYLQEKYGYQLAKFANPVYNIAEKYFGMQQKDRYLLQLIGTDMGRKLIDDNIWVDRFYEDLTIVKAVADKMGRKLNFCSDDCRFKNEYECLSQLGWVGIYLDVPEQLRHARLEQRDGTAQLETLKHVSETSIDEFKDQLYQLDASGTLEQTYEKLEELMEFIRRERHDQN